MFCCPLTADSCEEAVRCFQSNEASTVEHLNAGELTTVIKSVLKVA